MTVLVGDGGNVDLGAPLRLNDEQREAFFAFLEGQFAEVEPVHEAEARGDRLGDKFFGRTWTTKELAVLLDWRVGQEETCRRLGRSPMSVQMKMGAFSARFLNWCKAKGADPAHDELEPLIEQFLREKAEEKKERRRRARRNNPDRIKKEIESLEAKLNSQKIGLAARGGEDEAFVENIRRTEKALTDARNRLGAAEENA